jgi:hypothetical protein
MKIIEKDTLLLLLLLGICFFSAYFMPGMINRIIFLLILFAAYRTNLDYVYLIWFFIINDAPGRLFQSGEFAVEARIPLYPLAPGVSMGFQELFLLLYIVKYLQFKKPVQFIFKQEFAWFLIISLVFIAYSFFIGINFGNIVKTFRSLIPWFLVFIVPAFINDRQTLVRSGLLIFPVILFAFASVIFSYITGNYLDHYLRGVQARGMMALEEGSLSRSISAVYIILLSMILALYFSLTKTILANQNYLYWIILFCYLSIVLTGMRGWIIALSFLLLGWALLLIISREVTGVFRLVTVTTIAIFIVISIFPAIQEQMELVYRRVATVGAIAEGDVTAEGTLKRIDVRGPRVMNKFRDNPVFGWGFSNHYYEYQDVHVGHQSILLNTGIVGYVYLNGLFIYILLKILSLARNRKISMHEGNASLIFVLGLIVVFVIHSSSTQFWGYTLSLSKTLFFGFFFATVNTVFLQYWKESNEN